MNKIILFAACVLTFTGTSWSQMTVENAMTVEQYVTNVLLGQNVTVSNITYNGLAANTVTLQVGSFQANESNMPIASGVIMTSGNVQGVIGPNSSTSNTTDPGVFTENGTDADLLDLVLNNGGSEINHWSIIEFDFVPLGDTLRFNYVWASEEYDFYANSTFNDVFGFFISGPGINGPYSNNSINIALVPGTDIPVGINTINNGGNNDIPGSNQGPCENCEYYNQDFPSDDWYWDNTDNEVFTDPYYMQYDGYTDVLTAIAIVQCGETYHIKLAVCDGGDTSLDSAVFLEEDSFSSNIVVQVDIDFDVSGPDGETTFEDCGNTNIVFTRPSSSNPNTQIIAQIAYDGTATNGVDYTGMPVEVIFEPGVSEIVIPFQVIFDNITEPIETVLMTIQNIAECSGSTVESEFSFNIADTATPLTLEGETFDICAGETITIEPEVGGGYGVYGYDWSTGETAEAITVTPSATTTYFLTVSDTCGLTPISAQYPVTVAVFPPFSVTLNPGPQLTLECGEMIQFVATAVGGNNAEYQYDWTDENGETMWSSWMDPALLDYNTSWNGGGTVNVTVEDACGLTTSASVQIDLNVPPLVPVLPETITVACNGTITLTAGASGGFAPYNYSWYFNDAIDWMQWGDTYTGIASEAGVIRVDVSDNCGQTASAETTLIIDSPPITINLQPEYNGTCATTFNIAPAIGGGSPPFNAIWLENGDPIGFNQTLIYNTPINSQLELLVTDACSATANASTAIIINNPPILLDLGEDIFASCTDSTDIEANPTAGSGGWEYEWYVNGDSISVEDEVRIQSFETIEISVMVTDACGSIAFDTLTYHIPDVPLTLELSPDTTICIGTEAFLRAMADGGEGEFTYIWTPVGSTQPLLFLQDLYTGGIYNLVARDKCGKTIGGSINVAVQDVNALLTAEQIETDTYVFEGTTDPVLDSLQYFWFFGDGNIDVAQDTEHQFDGLDEYEVTLRVISSIGCMDDAMYTVYPAPILYIPTAFSPNNDGTNDVFKAVGVGIREFEMRIFNRWGDQIFVTTDLNDYWIGDDKQTGVSYVNDGLYMYQIKAIGFNNEAVQRTGPILIIR
jgi:gliding motility-associated-like protein